MARLMRLEQRRNIGWLRSRESLVCYSSQLEVDSAVDREPVQLMYDVTVQSHRGYWPAQCKLNSFRQIKKITLE